MQTEIETFGPFDGIAEDLACVVLAHVEDLKDRSAFARTSKVWHAASKRTLSLPEDATRLCAFARACRASGKFEEAVAWWKRAAAKGSTLAMFSLARSHEDGLGVKRDHAAAFSWLLEAAEAGCAQSMLGVAMHYQKGSGVERNDSKAFEWFLKGANAGSPDCMTVVGSCYVAGDGVERDDREAFEWFRRGAARDSAESMFLLGTCYQTGRGTERDLREAMICYAIAAERGCDGAKQALQELDDIL
jgi:TPR repeat protein